MKITIRRSVEGRFTAYVLKKDLESEIVDAEARALWGGAITLANGWRLELPTLDEATRLPITVEARKIGD